VDGQAFAEQAAFLHRYALFICVLLGLFVGSFLNVVIWRLPRGESVVSPPSGCPQCGSRLAWRDNVPVFSWLWLRGRCRNCSGEISGRYPAVELLTALLAGLLYLRICPTPLALTYGSIAQWVAMFGFFATLLAISFIDIDLWIIPNKLSIPGTFAGLLLSVLFALLGVTWLPPLQALVGAACGYGMMWLLAVVGTKAFAKKLEESPEGFDTAMGGGDLKLMGMIGAWLGAWPTLAFVIFSASLMTTLVAVSLRLATRGRLGRHIQFGPFLAAGALLFFLAGPELIDAYFNMISGPGRY